MIYLVNSPYLWEITTARDVLPTTKRVLPKIPVKKQRLESWELKKDDTQLREGGTNKKCGICKQVGQKRTNCPQTPYTPQQPTPSSTHQGTPAVQDP